MRNVVITGMGVVSPLGTGVDAFAQALFAGRHGIERLERFDTGDLAVKVHAPAAGYEVGDHFDAREARRIDPYARFGLVAAREAVADAGIVGAVEPHRLGVYLGTGLGGVSTLLGEADAMRERGPSRVSPLLVPKYCPNMLAGMVAIETGAHGPAMGHVSACSSGAVSIGEAVRAIRHGYADAVVCGAAEAMTEKPVVAGFQNLRALTTSADPDRACLPFDRERGGFVMGEGAAALVLESEEHARARGAEVYAVVSGYGVSSDAHHITAPAEDGASVARALGDALAEAGDDGRAPVHVNAHGTGTVKNDLVEALVLQRALADRALVTSTKSMTGHLGGAAGALEAVASVLALRRSTVPPTVGTRALDAGVHVDVVLGSARKASFDRAASLSMGFGGHNAVLVFDRP